MSHNRNASDPSASKSSGNSWRSGAKSASPPKRTGLDLKGKGKVSEEPRPSRHSRPSLEGVFKGLTISNTPAPSKSKSAMKTPLSGTISKLKGGFPNWCSFKRSDGGESPLVLKLKQASGKPDYSKDPTAVALFESCRGRIMEIRQEVDDLRKKGVDTSAAIDRLWVSEITYVIFGSNKIEHAGLDNLDETWKICQEVLTGVFKEGMFDSIPGRSSSYQARCDALVEAGAQRRGRREVVNHALAFKYLMYHMNTCNEPLSEDLIKETHKILCRQVPRTNGNKEAPWESYAGIYRSKPGDVVQASNTNFVTPTAVPRAMREYVAEIRDYLRNAEKESELDPIFIAAHACGEFVNIHPFFDGNGRLCRIILNIILVKYAGVMAPIGEHAHERKRYMDIVKDRSDNCCGNGSLAAYTAEQLKARLESAKKTFKGR